MNDWSKDFDEFDEDKKASSKGNNNEHPIQWMAFKKSGKYQVRLVGNYVKYQQWWEPFGRGVIVSPDDRNEASPTKAGFYPSTRFAILVLDKGDLDEDGVAKVKVLDKGPTVFTGFSEYYANNNINPAGKEGPDFIITVKNAGGLNAKYTVSPIVKPAPLTKAEIAKIREVKENWPELEDLKKAMPLEEIEKLWDALPEEKKVKQEVSKNESISTETTQAEDSAISEVEMDEEDDVF